MGTYIEGLVVILLIFLISIGFNMRIILSNTDYKTYWESIDNRTCNIESIDEDYERLYILNEEGEVIYEKIEKK